MNPQETTAFVKKEIANFARTLGSLLHNGVSILSALEITEEVLYSPHSVVFDQAETTEW